MATSPPLLLQATDPLPEPVAALPTLAGQTQKHDAFQLSFTNR